MTMTPNHPSRTSARLGGAPLGASTDSGRGLRKSQLRPTVVGMATPQDRVRQLIEHSGQSQGEFAQAVGLDGPKLSKALSGARRFSSLDYARIAERAQVSVDWLLTGHEPPLAMAARASAGTPARTAVGVAERMVELRATACDLGYPQKVEFVSSSAGASGLAYEQGAQLAQGALSVLAKEDLSSTAADLPPVIETAFGIDVAISDLGPDFDGLAASTPEASIILVSPSVHPARQRFTMAHELGHLLGADDQGVHPDADIERASVTKEATEVRANAFAATFLMPADIVRTRVGRGFDQVAFCALACDLLVSPSALSYRLRDLNLIDAMAAHRYRSLSLTTAARVAQRVPLLAAAVTRSGQLRPPGLLSRDLYTAYLEGQTTLRPYANLVGADTRSLRAELQADAESS